MNFNSSFEKKGQFQFWGKGIWTTGHASGSSRSTGNAYTNLPWRAHLTLLVRQLPHPQAAAAQVREGAGHVLHSSRSRSAQQPLICVLKQRHRGCCSLPREGEGEGEGEERGQSAAAAVRQTVRQQRRQEGGGGDRGRENGGSG